MCVSVHVFVWGDISEVFGDFHVVFYRVKTRGPGWFCMLRPDLHSDDDTEPPSATVLPAASSGRSRGSLEQWVDPRKGQHGPKKKPKPSGSLRKSTKRCEEHGRRPQERWRTLQPPSQQQHHDPPNWLEGSRKWKCRSQWNIHVPWWGLSQRSLTYSSPCSWNSGP